LPDHSIIRIESKEAWNEAVNDIKGFGICGLGIDTTGSDPLSCEIRLAYLTLPDGRVYVRDVFGLGNETLDDLAALIEDCQIKKVNNDAKPLLACLRASQKRRLKAKNIFDIMLASRICWAGYYYLVPSNSPKNPWKKKSPDHELEALAERHLGINLKLSCQSENQEEQELTPAQIDLVAKKAQMLLPIYTIFKELIAKNDLGRVAELEFRTISPVVEMELCGINLDVDAANALIFEKEEELVEAIFGLQGEAKRNGFVPLRHEGKNQSEYLDPDRQEDIKSYLRSQGFNIASTRADVLKELASSGNEFADWLLIYRRLSHQLAFLENWLQQINSVDGRIHPTYFQLQASTGRLTSRKPNAQQMPKRGEDALAIRKIFKAPLGKKLVKVDFACIEMRIMAYLSGDETMIKAFQDGVDLHRLTASKIAGQPIEQISEDQRRAAKIINFLLIYGGSAETLQLRALLDYGIYMSLEEAENSREKYFEVYSGVREWQEEQIMGMSYTHEHYFHNCVQGIFSLPLTCTFTALGRRRAWPRFGTGIKATKFQVFNTPCQGTGADLIKMVMCEVYDHLNSEDARIIGSIHDELLLEVPEEKAEMYAKMLSEIMNRIGSELLYPVPVISEAEILSSWGG
jgi:DNA polymerase I